MWGSRRFNWRNYHQRIGSPDRRILSGSLMLVLSLVLVSCTQAKSSGMTSSPSKPTPSATSPVKTIDVPASSAGWAIYHDPFLPFAFPVPTGWRVTTYHDVYSSSNTYTVGIVPPNNDFGQNASLPTDSHGVIVSPRGMYVHVTLDGPPLDPTLGGSSGVIRIPGYVLVGGAHAIVYDNTNGNRQLERSAVVMLGGYQYVIECHRILPWNAPAQRAQEDLPLFYAVLTGFHYGDQGK